MFFLLILVVAVLVVSPEQVLLVALLVVVAILGHLVLGAPPIFRRHSRAISAIGLGTDVVVLAVLFALVPFPAELLPFLAFLPAMLLAFRFGAGVAIGGGAVLCLTSIAAGRLPLSPAALLPWLAAAGAVLLGGLAGRKLRSAPPPVTKPAPTEALALEVFATLNQALATQPDSQRILELILELGSKIISPGQVSAIQALAFTFDSKTREYLEVSALLRADSSTLHKRFSARRGVFHEVIVSGDPVLTDHHQPPLDELPGLRDLQILLLPVQTLLDVYGLVLFAGRGDLGLDREGDRRVELLLAVVGQCALAFQNVVLQEELRRERAEILLNEEESRHRLARDFHDGPVQRVAAITMQLEFIKVLLSRQPERVIPELESIQALARQAAHEMRTMLFTLRPMVLETDGLVAAIRQLVQRLNEQEHANIQLETGQIPRLDKQIEETVFAVVQEALGNARKYARDAPTTVRLMIEGGFLVAQVEDLGPGFDVKKTLSRYSMRGSLGMVNMQERARLVDGRLAIDSAPGRGTIVSLAVPLTRSS